jgi:hypothetical protein
MPSKDKTPAEDHIIIEITSSIESAIFSSISDAIGKAPAPN